MAALVYLCRYETVLYQGTMTRCPVGLLAPDQVGTPRGGFEISAGARGQFAIVVTTVPIPDQTGVWLIGLDTDPIPRVVLNRVQAELGITLVSTTLGGMVDEILTQLGVVIRPGRDGRVHVRIGPIEVLNRAG